MKVGIVGSGTVGKALADGFLKDGHEVIIGTRDVFKIEDWIKSRGKRVCASSFKDAVKQGELVVFCPKGSVALEIIETVGETQFKDKIVIDVTNPFEFTDDNSPPKLFVGYPNSLGASIQANLPQAYVIKAFNTVTAEYMCKPDLKDGIPDMFIAGNDEVSKKKVVDIAEAWGWRIVDIGRIEESYLLEGLAMIWVRYAFLNNYWKHAFSLLRK